MVIIDKKKSILMGVSLTLFLYPKGLGAVYKPYIYIWFRFSTGARTRSVSVHVPGGLSDGQWHKVEVQYHNRSDDVG